MPLGAETLLWVLVRCSGLPNRQKAEWRHKEQRKGKGASEPQREQWGRGMGAETTEGKELELYFHIPFCVRKCLYCDFLSAYGDEDTKAAYMEALLAETAGSAVSYGRRRITSVFIGGGTPSAVPVRYMERLMEAVRKHYSLTEDAEVTMEVNPGTVSGEALRRCRRAGINRLSIGLQSARAEELALLGRIHTWEQFRECYRAAREAGFTNLNVDIMSALPGQTLSAYRETLEKVLSLETPPEHISAYSLILEEGTPFFEKYQAGELEAVDEDEDRAMYQETKRVLGQHGYHRYEISNYALRGRECRHNCGYWRRKDYLGLGIGAASLVENVRFRNGRELVPYLKDPLGQREELHALTTQEQMEEFMFLGLRMTEGVDGAEFRRLFGCGLEEVFGPVVRKNIRDGLLRELPEGAEGSEPGLQYGSQAAKRDSGSSGRFALTDRGLDLSNYVMAQFLL